MAAAGGGTRSGNGNGGVLLPRLTDLSPRETNSSTTGTSTRGANPNVAKRAIGWATPREPTAAPSCSARVYEDARSTDTDAIAALLTQQVAIPTPDTGPSDEEGSPPVANALETLELLLWESEATNEGARRRLALIEVLQQQRVAEEQQREQARLAGVEHMADTIRLLSDELERARSGSGAGCSSSGGGSSVGGGIALPSVNAAVSRLPHGDKKRRQERDETGPPDGDDSDNEDERDDTKDRNRRALLSPRLRDSPLRARRQKPLLGADNGSPSSLRTETLAKRAEQRLATRLATGQTSSSIRSPSLPPSSSLMAASSFELSAGTPMSSLDSISSREEKLRVLLLERGHWQREYAQMRDKVVEEKTRQVALFRRLDDARRNHLAQTGALEAALRGAHTEVELLRAQLAQARAAADQLQQRADDIARCAWEEKQMLVCSIAETRHKFKEWKEGEAATLKAARDQAVHNLKTEYELKIARHHEEKQKLRDKVKDLEVSLRLLQRDRHMSAVELSQRKSTILGKGMPTPSLTAVMTGATAEAELIAAQSRIKELEALLEYAKEYQKRQESVIKVSEAAITRLMQERDVVALENLALEPAAAMLPSLRGAVTSVSAANSLYNDHLSNVSGEYAGYALRKPARSRRSSVESMGQQSKASSSSSLGAVMAPMVPNVASGGVESLLCLPPSSPQAQTPLATALPTSKTSDMASSDPEKDILRRQSVVLSAELDKYRQLVVHSMDEIRSLKDQRMRSHQSLVATANGALGVPTVKEQYLMSELLKAQGELAELKRRLSAKRRSKSSKEQAPRKNSSFFDENDEGSGSDNDNSDSSSNSSSSSNSGDSCSDDEGTSESNRSRRSRGATHTGQQYERGESTVGEEGTGRQAAPHQLPEQEQRQGSDASTATMPTTATILAPPPPAQATESKAEENVASHDVVPASSAEEAAPEDAVIDVSASGAVEVIQKQGKAFLTRRAFVKKKLAIEKIKARYRGYLVRKNLEMLGCNVMPPPLPRAGGRARPNAVSEAAQYKMRVVEPHHETVCDCQGHVFKVVIRVSKDPSLVQMQMLPSTQNASQRHLLSLPQASAPEESHVVSFSRTVTRVAYFHLFEVIAALPYEEETRILEHTSEREIAAIVASMLRVVRISGEYKFMIDRKSGHQGGSRYAVPAPIDFAYASAIPQSGTLLAELPIDPMQPAAARPSVSSGGASGGEDEDEESAPEETHDLDCLIRDAQLPPEENALVPDPVPSTSVVSGELPRDTTSATTSGKGANEFLTPRQMRRLSMSLLCVIPER